MRFLNHSADASTAIPLLIVGGFPGAGTTRLVRHVLESCLGRRIVAIVRDVGLLVSDAGPGVRRQGGTVEWANGNLAVESDDPTATLATLARGDRLPDHVLVETHSGANPRRLGGYGYMPGYRPDGFVTVVDPRIAANAEIVDRLHGDAGTPLRLADVIVLNKLDLAGTEGTAAAQRSLGRIAPSARFVWCTNGQIAPQVLIGAAATQGPDDASVVAEWHAGYLPLRPRERRTYIGERCRSWCLLTSDGIESREFRAWVNHLPPTIVRGNGTVFLREEPRHRHEFSLIGARWQLRRGTPWGTDHPSTRITLVGLDGRTTRTRGPFADGDASAADDLARMVM